MMKNIYELLGVRTIINGQGPATRLSGGIMPADGAPAMVAAITAQTAAILHVATEWSRPTLPEVVAVAHAHGVPVLVDAAAQLPPAGNLRRFIAEGADLVVFSGGKALRGPQSSGILCGRRHLIPPPALPILHQATRPELWLPPADFIDR